MALEGGEGSASCPGCSLSLGKIWYPLYRRLGGPQGQSGQVQKISPPLAFDPQTVQLIASHYTNYAAQPTKHISAQVEKFHAIEIRLVHSQLFTRNHFHFLSVLESVISGVLLQQPKQVKVDCRVVGPEVPNEITAATFVSCLLYVGLHRYAQYHTMDSLLF